MKAHLVIGQGLVEYALILSMVAVVAIIILAILGPSVGNMFSSVYTNIGDVETVPQATPPTPTGAWVFCADEHDLCTFPGTKIIRYGMNGHYYTQTFTNHTPCTNEVFGDPIYGTFKACHYWDPDASG